MAVTIGSNINSLRTQRSLSQASNELERTYERLSSGLRINRASDDAAGLAIAASLNVDGRIYTQAIRNVNDGVSVLNVAQGALTELTGITERLRELAMQAANGTYGTSQRQALDAESDALTEEYNRIVGSTSVNGIKVLSGDMRQLYLQLGAGNNTTLLMGISSKLGQNKGNGTAASFTTISSGYGSATSGAVLADLNNDGKLDLVHGAGSVANGFVVQMGNGDGTFRAEVSYASNFSSKIQLADFNNDGVLDIVGTGSLGGDAAVTLGNGDGTFRAPTINSFGMGVSSDGSAVNSITIADFNNDGILDMAAIDNAVGGTSSMGILLGNGNGTFRIGVSRSTSGINTNSVVRAGDFNGDGRIDLIYNTSNGSGEIVMLTGVGDGTFSGPTTITVGAGEENGMSVADINDDGYLDIVGFGGSNAMTVMIGNGNGTFKAAKQYATSNGYSDSSLIDVNSDGTLDSVSVGYGSGSVEIRIGNGDGTFKATQTSSTGAASVFGNPAVGDINNDGAVELIFARKGTSLVQMNQNTDFSSIIESLNLNTRLDALSSLKYIDAAAARISSELSSIGSLMSRLSIANSNLESSRLNTKSAESRIMDVDIAAETAALTRTQILQQVGSSLLAQANQQPALALKLLQG